MTTGKKHFNIFNFLVLFSTALFIFVFSLINIAKFKAFYSTSFGWPYIFGYPKIARGESIFSLHVLPEHGVMAYLFGPINYIFAFFYGLSLRPETLFVFQAVIMAAGAIPIYLLSRKLIKNDYLAFVISLAYLLHPVVTSGAMLGFISFSVALPFFLWSFYYLERRDLGKFTIFIILANTAKIDAVLMGLILGILLYFTKEKMEFGKRILKINLPWLITALVLYYFYLRVSARPFPIAMLHLDKYGYTLQDALGYIAKDPFLILRNIFNENNMFAVIFLGLPSIFVILSPLFLIPIIPEAAFILIRNQHSSGHFLILAFVFAGSIYGIAAFLSYVKQKAKVSVTSGFLPVIILASVILVFSFARHYYIQPKCDFNLGPVPLTKNFSLEPLYPTPHTEKLDQFLSRVPSDATCLVSQALAPHMGRCRQMAIFSKEVVSENYDWDYILLDFTADDLYHISKEDFLSALRDMISSHNYGVEYFEDGVLLLRKGWNKDKNSEILKFINTI